MSAVDTEFSSMCSHLSSVMSAHHRRALAYNLHWLPVQLHVDFKSLTLTFKAVHRTAPSYICDLVTPYTPSRSHCSADSLTLQQPLCRLKSKGKRGFYVAAPLLWNELPLTLRNSPRLAILLKLLP